MSGSDLRQVWHIWAIYAIKLLNYQHFMLFNINKSFKSELWTVFNNILLITFVNILLSY